MQMTAGKEKGKKPTTLAGVMGQLQKGQMDPSAYSTYSEMGQPATWRSVLLPDADAKWSWVLPKILIQV